MMRTRPTVLAVIVAISSGCGNAAAPSLGMADTTFVATLSELRRAESDTSLDVTMRDSTRRLILRRHRVTSTQLEAASRILAQTPARASDLWRQIESVPLVATPRAGAPRPTPPSGNNRPVPH
jgi:hypothetical protein